MKITIIQVGKTKQSFFQESEQEYLKRLQPYAKIEIITLKEGQGSKNNPSEKEIFKQKEGQEILKHLPNKIFLVILDERGQSFSSLKFAEILKQKMDKGESHITFVIGGAFGLSSEILGKANLQLSFSQFTFTHEMIRTLLLEQLYRVFTIIQGKTYHY